VCPESFWEISVSTLPLATLPSNPPIALQKATEKMEDHNHFIGDAFLEDAQKQRKKFGVSVSSSKFNFVPADSEIPDLESTTICVMKGNMDESCRNMVAVSSFFVCYVVRESLLRVIGMESSNKLLLRGHESKVLDLCISPSDDKMMCSVDNGEELGHHCFVWRITEKGPGGDLGFCRVASFSLNGSSIQPHPALPNVYAVASGSKMSILSTVSGGTEDTEDSSDHPLNVVLGSLELEWQVAGVAFSAKADQLAVGSHLSNKVSVFQSPITTGNPQNFGAMGEVATFNVPGLRALKFVNPLGIPTILTASVGSCSGEVIIQAWQSGDRELVQTIVLHFPFKQVDPPPAEVSFSLDRDGQLLSVLARGSHVAAVLAIRGSSDSGPGVPIHHVSYLNLEQPLWNGCTSVVKRDGSTEEELELGCLMTEYQGQAGQMSVGLFYVKSDWIKSEPSESTTLPEPGPASTPEDSKQQIQGSAPSTEHPPDVPLAPSAPRRESANILLAAIRSNSSASSPPPLPPVQHTAPPSTATGDQSTTLSAVRPASTSGGIFNKGKGSLLALLNSTGSIQATEQKSPFAGNSSSVQSPEPSSVPASEPTTAPANASAVPTVHSSAMSSELAETTEPQPQMMESTAAPPAALDLPPPVIDIITKGEPEVLPRSSRTPSSKASKVGNSSPQPENVPPPFTEVASKKKTENIQTSSANSPMSTEFPSFGDLEGIVQKEIHKGVKELKSTMRDSVKSVVASGLKDAVKSLDANLAAYVTKGFKNAFEDKVIPAFEAGVNEMYSQLNQSFHSEMKNMQLKNMQSNKEIADLRQEVQHLTGTMDSIQKSLSFLADRVTAAPTIPTSLPAPAPVQLNPFELLQSGKASLAMEVALEQRDVSLLVRLIEKLTENQLSDELSLLGRVCAAQQLCADFAKNDPQEGTKTRLEHLKALVIHLFANNDGDDQEEDFQLDGHEIIGIMLNSLEEAEQRTLANNDLKDAVVRSFRSDFRILRSVLSSLSR
jgi:hypothetical protein